MLQPKDPSEKNGPKPWERFQIFLGGIPSFYTEEQVMADLAGKVTVRNIWSLNFSDSWSHCKVVRIQYTEI